MKGIIVLIFMATANCVRENYFTHHTVDECDKPAQYYNLSFYKCEPLDEEENFVPSTSGVYYQCDPKYKPTDYKLMMPESCEKCSDNQIYVPSLDDCVKCDESTSLCSCNNREYRRFIRATIPEDPENPVSPEDSLSPEDSEDLEDLENDSKEDSVVNAGMKETGMPIIAILLVLLSLVGLVAGKKQK